MKETYKDDTNVMTFSYDSKGKLISVVEKDYSNESYITNITWGKNIVKESFNSGNDAITYSIIDGLARTGLEPNGNSYSFAYNSSKQLTTYQYGEKEDDMTTRTLTWENGKVTKIAYDKEISEITYGNQTCKGYFPLTVLMVEDDFTAMLAHPELVGMRTTQLPSQINSKEGNVEYKEEYTYKLDKAGYVESCTVKETYIRNEGTETYTTNYTFKWE